MVGRVGVTGQYLMTDFKKQANIQMSPNDEGNVFVLCICLWGRYWVRTNLKSIQNQFQSLQNGMKFKTL